MCTLTFSPQGSQRHIFFNRDELTLRERALPPAVHRGENGNYIMPVDPPGGGSWMGLHENGFFVCLINHYPDDRIIIDTALRSRGLLIRDLLERGDFPAGDYLDSQISTAEYAPFYLAAFDFRQSEIWEFDGTALSTADSPEGILTSSSFQHGRISGIRRKLFKGVNRSDPAALRKFQLTQNKEHPEEGVLMMRNDASTVSVSHITIDKTELCLLYAEPPEFISGQALRLPKKQNIGGQV